MRLWPRSLTGQVILLLLLALVGSQILTFVILGGERHRVLRARALEDAMGRTLSVVKLLQNAPPAYLPHVLRTASQRPFVYRVGGQPRVATPGASDEERAVEARLRRVLGAEGIKRIHSRILGSGSGWWHEREGEGIPYLEEYEDDEDEHDEGVAEHHDDDDHQDHWRDRRGFWRGGIALSIQLTDGKWLNLQGGLLDRPPGWGLYVVLSLLVTALVVSLVVVLALRRITRPLRALTQASEAYGRGEKDITLTESGPEDMRRTIGAFNRMRERLDRFVRDRTEMLAAISHDLRTPITTLRLRAEFIENPEIQAKMLETLDDMAKMTEAILAYAREDAAREDTRKLDLAALLQSLIADLSDQGHEISYQGPERLEISARPVALKRAFGNLLKNAVDYGIKAQFHLEAAAPGLTLLIDDEGPGILPEDREKVFEPFFRLEESRSRDTGGIGMGLSIARSILRGHGGEITLEDSPAGGLRQRVLLPSDQTSGSK
jgi:signal transduction histidine kinase